MEYNTYYPVQTGPPPPPPPTASMNMQHDCSPVSGHMMPVTGPPPNVMHSSPAPLPPPNMRQTPCPSPMQQQHQSHHGHHMQTMPPQQPSPHPGYPQLPPHTPLSHSASPHPSTTPLQQPPSRPSTGPSPMHQQSPVHMNGPSPKVHSMPPTPQQHMNHHIPPGPPHPLTPSSQMLPMGPNQQPPPPHPIQPHNQNFIGGSMAPHQNAHYGQPPINPHQGIPPPPPMHHHGPPQPPLPPQSSTHQSGHPPPTYMSHMQQPAPLERGSPFFQHIPQTEFRIIELNKRLQHRPRPRAPPSPLPLVGSAEESNWWEKFVSDFFDDDSSMTLQVPGEDKPVEYSIGRTLLPRFFRSYFEGGVTDLAIKLHNTRETAHHINSFVTLDCDQTDITTKNLFKHPATNMTMNVVVHTEGHLSLDFVSNNYNDNLLIKSWRFYTHQCHEYIDRSMTTTGLPNAYLIEPVTRYGLTKTSIAYLKMCMIMEPMQDLMLQHRQTKMDPRSCLKHLLYDKYKLKIVDDTRAQPSKRRKRKAPAAGATGNSKKSKANANSVNNSNAIINSNMGMNSNLLLTGDVCGMQNLPLASQDVLVVGEPSMLGADFGDENERRITRLENNQFDSSLLNGNNNNINCNKIPISQNQSQINSDASNQIMNHNNIGPHQNNHDSGGSGGAIQSILNHSNNNHNNGNGTHNNNTISNNSMMNEHNLGTPNSSGNNNSSTVANSNNINGNNYQMNLMINANTNHVNHPHITKSEMDLKQQQHMTTSTVNESEAR